MRNPILLFLLCSALAATAQQTGQNTTPTGDGSFTLKVSSQFVVETVVVRDKNGNPVTGLTQKDFSVTEDGAEQNIRLFEYQDLPKLAADRAAVTATQPEDIKIYKKLSRTQIAAEPQDSPKYRNRRLMGFYFDMSSMDQSDQLRTLAAAEKFVRTQMQAEDRIAIFRYSGGGVDVLQDFTEDRNRLLSILETMVVGEGQGLEGSLGDESGADVGAAFGQNDSEFNIFNTDRQLSALQTAAKMLAQLPEKKIMLYFSGGMHLNGLNNQAQLQATVNDAIRSGVSFWPIDARGLVAQAPLGDASHGNAGGIAMYNGSAAGAMMTSFRGSQDTLFALAGDTGGKAFLDNNDLTRGIRQAQESVSSYYLIGYYTSNTSQDGKFRRIKITLNGNPDAKLEYRQGYYAGKVFGKFTVADKERQLEDALMLKDPVTELTIAMEVDYFQLNRAEYFVPIVMKIPGRELALAKHRGASRTLIDFIGEIKDNYGVTVTNLRDKVNIKIDDRTAAELAKRPIEYDAGFTLLPGKYKIKVLARDDETGRIGTYEANFTVPNLVKQQDRVPISSVVLGSQKVDLKDALYNAVKEKDREKVEAVNPLVENGQKLIPSVTRVFRQDQELFVYLQSYQVGAQQVQPVVAYLTFFQDQKKVLETQPMEVTESNGAKLPTLPLRFTIPLKDLPPGEYTCQVSVLDPAGQRTAFWTAPVMVIAQ